ncbi:MAG: hypothetical protein V4754_10360 [Pseudomonadota bacterium]
MLNQIANRGGAAAALAAKMNERINLDEAPHEELVPHEHAARQEPAIQRQKPVARRQIGERTPAPTPVPPQPNNGFVSRINFRETDDNPFLLPSVTVKPDLPAKPSTLNILAPAFTPGRPARPFQPVRLARPQNYGTHNAAQTITTQYARQMAHNLVDEQGGVDRTHLFQLIEDASNDPMLPPHQKKHVIKTLLRLQNDPVLRNVIESTCAPPNDKLRGPAADLVRASLNLPPSQQSLSAVDARRAVVMSLLGNLRQGKVGSCFASATAIAIQNDDPRQLAQDLRQLLQTNTLNFQNGNKTIQLPLNRRISREAAQTPIHVDSNGFCHGEVPSSPSRSSTALYSLAATPAMQAALTAIGIAPQEHQAAVGYAIRNMNHNPNYALATTSENILKELTRGKPDQRNRMASALNAFAGSEDVRLLRAWEYTLATHSESDNSASLNSELVRNMVYGNQRPGNNNAPTLMGQNQQLRGQLKQHGFATSVVEGVNRDLMSRFEQQIQSRFVMQYDADIKQPSLAADGRSSRGGFTLYDRTPANDPSRWVRIDNPQTFQSALAHMASTAAQQSEAAMRRAGTMSEQHQQVLRHAAQLLRGAAGSPVLTDHLVRVMNPDKAHEPSPDLQQCAKLPWKLARGGSLYSIDRLYGGHGQAAQIVISQPQNAGHGAYQLLNMLSPHMHNSRDLLKQRHQQSDDDFSINVYNENHAFNIKPHALREFWALDGNGQSAQEWVFKNLDSASTQHASQGRREPHLYKVIEQVADQMGIPKHAVQRMYGEMTERSRWTPSMGPPVYNLASVRAQLEQESRYFPNPALAVSQIHSALDKTVPPPTRLIADTNWAQPDGSPTFVGLSFNPHSRQLEANLMNEAGGNRTPLGTEFFEGRWGVFNPLATAGKGTRR